MGLTAPDSFRVYNSFVQLPQESHVPRQRFVSIVNAE
jgi:hypothetical protein